MGPASHGPTEPSFPLPRLYKKQTTIFHAGIFRHVSTHQFLIIQGGPVHQSERDACLSSSEGLREEEETRDDEKG